jgi:hypothetical protein
MLVGQTILNQAVPMAIDKEGGITLLSIHKEDSTYYPHIIQLDRDGMTFWERKLDIPMKKPGASQIIWDEDELVLVWIDDKSLYSARINNSGDVHVPPSVLSWDLTVDSFDIVPAPNGTIYLWFGGSRRVPGIYYLSLDDETNRPIQVDPLGIHPTIQFDGEGALHTAWLTYQTGQIYPHLYYVIYPKGVYQPDQQALVTEVAIRSDSLLTGPQIGLDTKRVYVFWNVVARSGNRMNMGTGFVLHFPRGKPELASNPELILIPQTTDLLYEYSPGSGLGVGAQVLLGSRDYPLISPDEIVVSKSIDRTVVLGLRLQIPYRDTYPVSQLGTLSLHEDGALGYQLLTVTPRSSLSPALQVDESGKYYLTWIERVPGSGYAIYFASTAPDIQETLSQLTRGDISRMVADTFFGLLKGATVTPVAALMWLAIPGILLALTWKLREYDDNLIRPASLVTLVLGLAAFWVGKIYTFMTVDYSAFVPFSSWLPVIPVSLFVPIQVGIPLVIFGIALGVAIYYARRNNSTSVALFVVTYGAADSLLTMAIYCELLLRTY